jgi:predicted O-methyltransferase YrrM
MRHLAHGTVLEIGLGSSAVLGALGAARLIGPDIDPGALTQATALLREIGQDARVAGRRPPQCRSWPSPSTPRKAVGWPA